VPWRIHVGSLLVADEVNEHAVLLDGDVSPFLGLVRVLLAGARDEANDGVELPLRDEIAQREARVDVELR
jgi:hypothetical protein